MRPGHTEEGGEVKGLPVPPTTSPSSPSPRQAPSGKGQVLHGADLSFFSFPARVGHKNASLINWGHGKVGAHQRRGRRGDAGPNFEDPGQALTQLQTMHPCPLTDQLVSGQGLKPEGQPGKAASILPPNVLRVGRVRKILAGE